MLELTGIASILRGISFLYWLLAASALALVLWKVKPRWGKAVGALLVMGVFGYFPLQELIEANKREAYAREAWAYFKKKCETESGEKIYKTYTGVKSVLVVKPLPPATEKDLYDQFWYGDPYSNATPHDQRDISKADTLLRDLDLVASKSHGFEFVEIQRNKEGAHIIEKVSPNPADMSKNLVSNTSEKISRFAIGWEDISKPEDRRHWVAGSRLSVIDLTDNSVVAERIGYLIEAGFGSTAGQRRPWLTARGVGPNGRSCPAADTFTDRLFVLKALRPVKE